MFNIMGYAKMGGVFALVATLAYGAHWFIVNQKDNQIQTLENRVVLLTDKNSKLETAAVINEETIRSLDSKLETQNKEFTNLTNRLNAVTEQRDEYLSIFRRHDLTNLARAKPGLIERRINSGTKKVFDTLEDETRENN